MTRFTGPVVLPVSVVDTHAHIFRTDLPMAEGRRYSPTYNATIADYIAQLDANGCSHGILVQPSFLGSDNSFMLDAIRHHSDRLRGVAVIEPEIPDAGLEALADGGIVSIRLNLIGREPGYSTPARWLRVFEFMVDRRWQLEIQCGMQDLAGILSPMLETGLEVVVDHFGLPSGPVDRARPGHAAFLDLLAEPNLWLKLSAPYRAKLSLEEALKALRMLRDAAGGRDRFLWGSDWPHTQHEAETAYADQIRFRDALLTDAGDRQAILSDNPARLFHFA